ncbi:hypothetical protein HanLR1_Chr13g0500681 [Helianthus annuus]|nr:hypothetical protein HanLR1_Chr13g0500681 [Helianthus annuus]
MNNSGDPMRSEGHEPVYDKMVEVHSETSTFFDLQGRAVVGRAKDIGNLIKLKDSLRSADISGFNLYFLGGGSEHVDSFRDEIEASDFILNINLWKEWFEMLDIWSGQKLAYKRIAWLKFHGVPLHLAENKVFNDIASQFGKVINGSQLSPNNWDLSTSCVGVLVDIGSRISGSVLLKWKNKKFKVWVMEELDDWVPDCMFEEEWPSSVSVPDEGDADDNLSDVNEDVQDQDMLDKEVGQGDDLDHEEEDESCDEEEGSLDGSEEIRNVNIDDQGVTSSEPRSLARDIEQSGNNNGSST